MKKIKSFWILGAVGILLIVLVPVISFWPRPTAVSGDPWANVPQHPVHTSHADIVQGPFETPQDVTRACLECHPEAASDVMMTTHWTWESQPFEVSWRDEPVTIGKINQINNFCISAQGNQHQCMTCHIGYAWSDETPYDFTEQANVDCLVCHADMGIYAKGTYGNPAEGVDLLAAAQSVRAPTRENCGSCHFNGGGGNNVKHGDLAESLYFPDQEVDVHMGGNDFLCTDCHVTQNHEILGRLVVDNVTIDPSEQVACATCHTGTVHTDERLTAHVQSVACQTCHIPTIALDEPTKTYWDWSTAGLDRPEEHFTYLRIKGTFIYEQNLMPTYLWFNGNLDYRYLLGDLIDFDGPTFINVPSGNIHDPTALIFPFKVHVANQPYDTQYGYLLAPITSGPNGYWTNFDWDNAFRLSEPITGLAYSGHYDFTETWMFWPSTHMVQPADRALQCDDCHGENGRLDWIALGYPGDPIEWGGRFQRP
ncbi:MAG: tetrathionate reductase family octaheme c-type cytochrome [Anaerolineales bacterium]|nr:tetrathionate reductase family octaheme c-type cytochrome [Anaerolineales bacterium]